MRGRSSTGSSGLTGNGSDAHVAVFRGLHTSPFGIDLYRLDESTDLPVTDLPPAYRTRVRDGIEAESADDAERILAVLSAHRLPLCPTPGATDNSSGGVVRPGVDCREG